MKSVFFPTPGGEYANIADCAKINAMLGNEVVIVLCNDKVCHCWQNMNRNKGKCKMCQRQIKWFANRMPSSVKLVSIDDYAEANILNKLKNITFKYQNIEDIKKIEYEGVNIGYGCLSAYVTITRNLNPKMDDKFKDYFDSFLRSTCYLVHCQKTILMKEKPEQIYFFNGRFSHVRPLVELANKNKIEYTCTEGTYFFDGKIFQNNFVNTMPHNIEAITKLMENDWNDISVSQSQKEWLGNLFFQSKVNGNYIGDTNYTAEQSKGQLPEGWDNTKKNYVIFNSSEDEFCSIGDEFDKKKVFKSQIEGISFIAENLQKRDDIHLYLRIHPNLKNIKYRYHTDLLELGKKYKNLTVIPGNSPISSYSLIGVADRIIVFGSTIGAESSYWGKPVINLAGAVYYGLNITYNPKTQDELLPLLQVETLNNNANKTHLQMYGYYYMNIKRPRCVYFNQDLHTLKIMNRVLKYQDHQKIMGSSVLYLLYSRFLREINKSVRIPFLEE